MAGAVAGTVRGEDGPLEEALVTLRESTTGATRFATTDNDGTYSFPFVLPGVYDLRVEAFGTRPVLVEAMRVSGGRSVHQDVALPSAEPPVARVDTVAYGAGPASVGATLEWVDPVTLRALPDRVTDLRAVAELSTVTDEGLGYMGLPERYTSLVADGVAFEPARHPAAVGDPAAGAAFPVPALLGVSATGGVGDIEWSGAAGGFIALSTGVPRGSVPEVYASWGSDALWSSSAFDAEDAPSFSSIAAGGGATMELVPDTARLHVAFQGARRGFPRRGLLSDSLETELFPDREDPELALPSTDEVTSASAQASLDWLLDDGLVVARAGGGVFDRERGAPAYREVRYPTSEPATEGADGTLAVNVVSGLTDRFALEVRAGASHSSRDYGLFETDLPSTLVVGPGVSLGPERLSGSVSRTTLTGSPVLHFTQGIHRLKAGVDGRFSSLQYDGAFGGTGVFASGGPATLLDGRGAFLRDGTTPADASFSVAEVGGFLQYRWVPLPTLAITAGVRYDLETLPVDDVRLDARWAELTGILNGDFDSSVGALSARLFGSWDLTGRGRTWLEAGVAVEHDDVDPAALAEVIANDGRREVERAFGDVGGWPGGPGAVTRAASLSLFGPDLEAPRTTRGTAGFAQRLPAGLTLRVSGTVRRTEFLLRRADLNQPVVPSGTDATGRPLAAPVTLEGGVVGAAASGRRFPEYDAVWALNADGWSRYEGITVSLQRSGGAVSGFASWTASSTEDNLLGLGSASTWAALSPGIRSDIDPWEEGTSNLDVPHRVSAGLFLHVPGPLPLGLDAVYRWRSGLPFTPMVAPGLDANGDGSWLNDVASVPGLPELPDDPPEELVRQAEAVEALYSSWSCLTSQIGAFAERNSCRGDSRGTLDLRFTVGPLHLGDVPLEVMVDLLNVTDSEEGVRDDALLRLDPDGAITMDEQGRPVLPWQVNPGFGDFRYRLDPGRLLRVGLRVGAGR